MFSLSRRSLAPLLERQRPIRRQVLTVYEHHGEGSAAPLVQMDCGHIAVVAKVADVREHHDCPDCATSEAMRQLLDDYLLVRT